MTGRSQIHIKYCIEFISVLLEVLLRLWWVLRCCKRSVTLLNVQRHWDLMLQFIIIKGRSILGHKVHSGSLSAQYVFYEDFKLLGRLVKTLEKGTGTLIDSLHNIYPGSETFKIFVLLYTYTNAHMVTL